MGGLGVPPTTKPPGAFVLSLDLQLYWGLHHRRPLDHRCRQLLLRTRRAVPRLLKLLERFDVRATWAPLGLVICRTKDEVLENLPARLPAYGDLKLSPFTQIPSIGEDEGEDPYHFGASLVEAVADHPGQELAAHTFCIFRGREDGAGDTEFEADLRANLALTRQRGWIVRSLVMPDDHLSPEQLRIAQALGLTTYRCPPPVWPYKFETQAQPAPARHLLRRIVGVADRVLPLTGTRCVAGLPDQFTSPVAVPTTRRLWPVPPGSRAIDALQRRRLFAELDAAAHRGQIFHLFSPLRDFGRRSERQLALLERLLLRFDGWRRLGRMRSMTMHEIYMHRRGELATDDASQKSPPASVFRADRR